MHLITSREALENEIITRYQAGESIRSLSRLFKMGRNTIRRIIRKHKAERDGPVHPTPKKPRPTKLDPYLKTISNLLEKYPRMTAVRICEEIRIQGYEGGITQVQARVKKMRSNPKEPVIRYKTEPGQMGQMDWSPYRLSFANGTKMDLQCFSYVLKYSGRQYVDFCEKRDFHSLIRRHVAAFHHFGGVPQTCLYDGEKTILLRWEAGRPVYNPSFVAFLTHYRCRPIGCRPGRPQTKGAVEVRFRSIENHLLGGRTFLDLHDLRQFTQHWLAETADQRIRNKRSVIDLFKEEERDTLIALPTIPYDTAEIVMRVGNVDGNIELETNKYSIPYDYMGEILTVKAEENEVRVYSPEIKLIAHHERLPNGAGQSTEDPEHRRMKGLRHGLEPVRDIFLALGEGAQEFLEGLKHKHPRTTGIHARQILSMKNQYHSDDINKALKHASRYCAFDAKAIKRILQAKAKSRTLESTQNKGAIQKIIDSAPHIKQRDLDEYDQFLNQRGNHEPKDH